MNFFYFIFVPVTIFVINFFFNKTNFLQSLTGDNHQLFVEKKNIPLSGGIFLFIFSLIFFISKIDFYYFFVIFLIGFLSDIKILKSAKIRFFLQVVSIFLL